MKAFARLKTFAACVGFAAFCTVAQADNIRFTLHKAMDINNSGHVAISYLIPAGWEATDNINWDMTRRTAPLEFNLTAQSPDKRSKIGFLNAAVFKYTLIPGRAAAGTVPPQQATDVLLNNFKNAHPGMDVEIVDRQENPVRSIFVESPESHTRALECSLTLRYTENGVPMRMKYGFNFDSYAAGTPQGLAQGYVDGYWQLVNVSSVGGIDAGFAKTLNMGGVMLSSRRFDPQFFQQYLEIVQGILVAMQQANQERIDAEFRRLRQSYHDLSESSRQKFDELEESKDKFTRNMCDYALDQQRFTDGKTEFIMPSGYSRAVSNGDQYMMTDDKSYQASGDWHDLTKVN